MAIVHDFPSIARILNRQVQKAEFDASSVAVLPTKADVKEIMRQWFKENPPRPFELPDLRGRVKVIQI